MTPESAGRTGLARALGLPALTFYGVGQILGAGIYSVIGAAAGVAGSALWMSFLLAAAVALFTGLSYAELGAAFPEAGAEYVYVRRAFPAQRWMPFAIGVVIILAGAATAGTVALAFGGYLKVFVGLPPPVAALGLLALFTVLSVAGIRESTWANVLFTVVETAGLVLVIGLGLRRPDLMSIALTAPNAGVLAGASLVFFAYLGFEDIANLTEEARNPGRDVPRAILLSLVLTTLLYVLASMAAVALVRPQELAASESPLAAAVARVSPRLVAPMGAIALFATANTALITLIVGSRMLYAMGRGGDLPPLLGNVLPGRRTPWVAAVAMFALSTALLVPGEVALAASFSSFGALLAFATVNASVVALRYRAPEVRRPFTVPLAFRRTPLLPILGAVSALVLALQFRVTVYLVGAGTLLAAVALRLALPLWGRGGKDFGRSTR